MDHNRTGMPAVLAILLCTVTACSPFETPIVPTPVATTAPAAIPTTPAAPTAPTQVIPTLASPTAPAGVEGEDDLNCPIKTITGCETQTVHLAISLTGVPFNLYYASDRVPGRASQHPWDVRLQGLGGWTFNVHHAYDPKSETLYLGNGDRYQIAKPVLLTGSSAGDILIAAADATEIYHFNADGRHLRTLDALTGAMRYAFSYDENGKLVSIKDRDGNVTTIERSGNGEPIGVSDPAGHSTTLRLDEHGYLAEVVNPANETIKLEYTSSGLLTTYIDAEGNDSHFSYDGQGRLGHAELPDGIGITLSRADTPGGYTITLMSSL